MTLTRTTSDETWAAVVQLSEEERWREVVRLLSRHPDTMAELRLAWQLGWAYFKLGELSRALRQFRRTVAAWPSEARAHWALGAILRESNQFEKAEVCLLRSIALRDSHLGRLSLALVYMQQGRLAEAERVHLEGLRLKSNHRERAEAFAEFLDDTGRPAEALEARKRAEAIGVTEDDE